MSTFQDIFMMTLGFILSFPLTYSSARGILVPQYSFLTQRILLLVNIAGGVLIAVVLPEVMTEALQLPLVLSAEQWSRMDAGGLGIRVLFATFAILNVNLFLRFNAYNYRPTSES